MLDTQWPTLSMLNARDIEHGKKSDDLLYTPARRGFPRWRRRRVLVALVSLLLFTVGMHNLRSEPATAKKPTHTNPFAYTPPREPDGWQLQEPTGPPPGIRAPRRGEAAPRSYSGKFKFYRLAASLRGAAHTDGFHPRNRNVVFAFAGPGSAAALVPVACEMARWQRNWVHGVLVGRSEVPMEVLLAVNGVDADACPVIWHDARPDYAAYSSEERAEASVQSALSHVHSFLHPQVVVVDDAGSEDGFFTRGVRNATSTLEMGVIEIPKHKSEELMWMARLDAQSLKNWHVPSVDVVIQVPPDSSRVMHLLASLAAADYAGLTPPRLTLDLPAALDPALSRFLTTFTWPPRKTSKHTQTESAPQNQLLLLRRRITQPSTPLDSAVRTAELFYPANPDAHTLLLAPDARLSRGYMHYLQYTLLAYRYASTFTDEALAGLSLHVPAHLDDGSTPAHPSNASRGIGVFGVQSAESSATLWFGGAWGEWHAFLRQRVRGVTSGETEYTAWTGYLLEYLRLRGGFVVCPPVFRGGALVALEDTYSRGKEKDITLLHGQPLLSMLGEADLPLLLDMPLLLHNGSRAGVDGLETARREFVEWFRGEVGGCKGEEGLFCYGE